MRKERILLWILVWLVFFQVRVHSQARGSPGGTRSFGKVPLQFQKNNGQVLSEAPYVVVGANSCLHIDSSSIILGQLKLQDDGLQSPAVDPNIVQLQIQGADLNARIQPMQPTQGYANWLRGNVPDRWIRNVPVYSRLWTRDIYPGIDWVCYGTQNELEYDFVISPGYDPEQIRLSFKGAREIALDRDGSLVIAVGDGSIRQAKPFAYQRKGGAEMPVEAEYVLGTGQEVRFKIGKYDLTLPLIIDPVLLYSAFLGGPQEFINPFGIVLDRDRNVCIIGQAVTGTNANSVDIIVAKLSADGSKFIFSTVIGGSQQELPGGISVDNEGNIYVSGTTFSADFPVIPRTGRLRGASDAFVAKIAPSGDQLLFATFVGGSGAEYGTGIALDKVNSIYLTGGTTSTDFIRPNVRAGLESSLVLPFQERLKGQTDAFVVKMKNDGSSFDYKTYLGGVGADTGLGAVIDENGNACVVGVTLSRDFPVVRALQPKHAGGSDTFVTQLNSTGSSVNFSTFIGGSGNESPGFTSGLSLGAGIALDNASNLYIGSETLSPDLFTTNAIQTILRGETDGFLAKIANDGSRFFFCTYFGGDDDDTISGVAVDDAGNIYMTGGTGSQNFPNPSGVSKSIMGPVDAFAAKLEASGTVLQFADTFGGSGVEVGTAIALNADDGFYIAGLTASTNFPPIAQTDGVLRTGFISKFGNDSSPPVSSAVIRGYRWNQNGEFELDVLCERNRKYKLEFSPDLAIWSALIEFTQSSGEFFYKDEDAPFFARRFYRIRPSVP